MEELAKQFEVESIEQINYNGRLIQHGVTYHFLNFKKKKLWFPLRLHRYIKNLNPDAVFVNGFIFPIQIMQLRKMLGKKVKIIVLHRAEKPFTGIKGYVQKLADKSVDAYFFASDEFGEEWIRKGIIKSHKKIHEVMQSSSTFHIEDKIAAKKILNIDCDSLFLWVGRLNTNKDPLTVIKAFKNYLLFQPGVKLYMVYQTDELLPEIKNLINTDNKTRESIVLVGKVEHRQLQAWYNATDFFISGSHYEGSGISVCEAMSCGCIPVLTDIISFRRMTGPGKCGLLYKPGNEKELLDTLLKTKELDLEMEGKKVVQQFHEELSFDAIARKINKVISSL